MYEQLRQASGEADPEETEDEEREELEPEELEEDREEDESEELEEDREELEPEELEEDDEEPQGQSSHKITRLNRSTRTAPPRVQMPAISTKEIKSKEVNTFRTSFIVQPGFGVMRHNRLLGRVPNNHRR